MPTAKTNKKIALNVYLLKRNTSSSPSESWSHKEFLARPVGANGKAVRIRADVYPLGPTGKFGTLFIRKPLTETEPEWLGFIRSGLENKSPLAKLKNRSVSAVLLIERNERQFAISFGHGRYMIEPRLIEDRFGIRVVLNSISPDKVASIDRQTFDASPRISRVQTAKATSVADFIINPEQDLLRGLVGLTKPEYQKTLGAVIAGIDSFKTSVAIELPNLSDFLSLALSRSESKDYLARDSQGNNSQFAWVENLLPIKDKALVDLLDNDLWNKLIARDIDTMWLAVPDIVDWSVVTGFQYTAASSSNDVATALDLREFLDTLRRNANIETVKRREILMLMANGLPAQRFSAFKCIYAEVKRTADLFILHVGTWFRIESSFQKSVEDYFRNFRRKTFAPPFLEYEHIGEGPYNEAVCAGDPGTHGMLDRQLIKFGGSYDKIEVCDILAVPPAGMRGEIQFIHVKRGRSSSNLSHLFAQGLVASTLLVKEKAFVVEVNKQLAKLSFSPLPEKFSAVGSEVVFAIIDGSATTPFDIPFFSKVNLQNCGKSIAAFGYSVSLMRIPEAAAYLATKGVSVKKATVAKTAAVAKKAAAGKKTVVASKAVGAKRAVVAKNATLAKK